MRDEVALIEERTGARLSEAWLAEFRERRNQALDRDLVEIPGAPDAVRALHGILDGRIAVASGADRRKVEFQLAKVGIADCFDGRVFSGHEMPRSKPFRMCTWRRPSRWARIRAAARWSRHRHRRHRRRGGGRHGVRLQSGRPGP